MRCLVAARAYGYARGRSIPSEDSSFECSGSRNHTPTGCKLATPDYNVKMVSPPAGSSVGTYCFRAGTGLHLGLNAVVVVDVVGPLLPAIGNPPRGLKGSPTAVWVPGAPSCGKGQLEIDTDEIETSPAGLQVTPTGWVSFSFVIP